MADVIVGGERDGEERGGGVAERGEGRFGERARAMHSNWDYAPGQVVIAAIDKLGYPSWIGAEYKPRASVEAGLGWMKAY